MPGTTITYYLPHLQDYILYYYWGGEVGGWEVLPASCLIYALWNAWVGGHALAWHLPTCTQDNSEFLVFSLPQVQTLPASMYRT